MGLAAHSYPSLTITANVDDVQLPFELYQYIDHDYEKLDTGDTASIILRLQDVTGFNEIGAALQKLNNAALRGDISLSITDTETSTSTGYSTVQAALLASIALYQAGGGS